MSIYQVTGPRSYRGHPTGDIFETILSPDSEALALRVGAIRVLEHSTPGLRPGSWKPPRGWHTTQTTEAPAGASLIEGSIR